jgi:uncharacterized damage-inducible protein DinB
MTLDELQILIEYHYWARDRLLESVEKLTPEQFSRDLGSSFKSVRETVVHLMGGDWIWCSRWEGVSPDAMPDAAPFTDLETIRAAWIEQERKVRAQLARFGELGVDTLVEYRRAPGEPRQAQPFWQMVQHLVNHGSFHRGQVVTMLRQMGATPPVSVDLMAFYRGRNAAAR